MGLDVKAHVCVDCIREGATYAPRPAHLYGRKRLCRCVTHERAEEARVKLANHHAYVVRQYGISKEDQIELWEYQGRCCPCGRQPTRMPDTEHDHRLARLHGHPVENACPECLRGLTCRGCNREVLDRYTPAQLRALADYLEDPPYQRMRRQRNG